MLSDAPAQRMTADHWKTAIFQIEAPGDRQPSDSTCSIEAVRDGLSLHAVPSLTSTLGAESCSALSTNRSPAPELPSSVAVRQVLMLMLSVSDVCLRDRVIWRQTLSLRAWSMQTRSLSFDWSFRLVLTNGVWTRGFLSQRTCSWMRMAMWRSLTSAYPR